MSPLAPECPPPALLDAARLREDFPIFAHYEAQHGKPLTYLDNGATTHKPQAVIDAISTFYSQSYGTVRRGVYALSEGATAAYHGVREQVAGFLNAPNAQHIIFTKGTTEALNLVAHGFGWAMLNPGDRVVITGMEHHANIVPWQQIAEKRQATVAAVPIRDDGTLDRDALRALLAPPTKILAITHVANSLGTINPIAEIIAEAHAAGIPVLVDGAQGAPHMPVDVQALDCDFYCFSGHKLYGPTGIGVLSAKTEWLERMVPYQCGGDMIDVVTLERTTFTAPPHKFEAGTPPIAEVIGLGAALSYVTSVGMAAIDAHERALLNEATQKLLAIDGLRIIGTAPNKAGLVSFTIAGAHPLDLGTLLDQRGVAIRTGHHCAQPVMQRFGVTATARASFGLYNTPHDIDTLVDAIQGILPLLR